MRHNAVAGVCYLISNQINEGEKNMESTLARYEAFYYLHRLLPYLETFEDVERKLNKINRRKDGGLIVPISRGENEKLIKPSDMYPRIVASLAQYSLVYNNLKQRSVQQENISYLARILHLNSTEEMMVQLLSALHNNRLLRECLKNFEDDIIEKEEILTAGVGLDYGTGAILLKERAPLKKLGIVQDLRYNSGCELTEWATDFINTKYKNDKERYKALMGTILNQNDKLTSKDFTYVEASELALKLMNRAKKMKGFNILLYGASGTGKTSFAQVLARSAKLDLYPVDGDEDKGGESNRLKQFYCKQSLLKNIKNACVLVENGEDLLSRSSTGDDKLKVNNLLENNDVPVIWTTNKIYRMDLACVRRFTLSVCFNNPPVQVRQKIWHRYLVENQIACSKEETSTLAKRYEIAPSIIVGAAQTARMAKGDINTVKEHLSFTAQALNNGHKQSEDIKSGQKFCPMLVNADIDLNALTGRLKELGRLNFSLCLYGASGTGKSAYARYLAEELGLNVFHHRASDLISCYVGETEQNIAKAFVQARENKSLLIFDEADTFLRDRASARYSWEISSVNEMLTWMESHPYPFICTTNLMDALDPASLRRFGFKVKYDFLTNEQVKEAFSYFFGLNVTVQQVGGLDKLAPGDFALVKNKAEILGKSRQFEAIKEMLETEQKLKHNAYGGAIGFRAN